jgi:WS/DGAT/MGAT family acyltransferase
MNALHMHDEPLSPIDTACLRIEDRTSLIVNAGVMVFTEPLDFELLRETFSEQLLAYRRFRQRVVSSDLPMRLPHWEDDPLFDLRSHLHRIALPSPGDDRALQVLLSDLVSTPLDHAQPLWQVHLIENYGGGCAVLFRLHHSLADGMALLQVVRAITSKGPEKPRKNHDLSDRPLDEDQGDSSSGLKPEAVLSEAEVLLHQGITALFHPSASRELAGAAADAAATLGKMLLMGHDSPTLFKGPLGVMKHLTWSAPVSVRELKASAHALSAAVIEVLLCAVTGALRRYLVRRGEDVCDISLRVSIPVNMRHRKPGARLGNRFSLNILALPVDRGDPLERLEVLQHRLRNLRETREAEILFGLMHLYGLVPSEVGNLLVNLLSRCVTGVLSSVPGPARRVYLAGKPVERMFFWVPQSGRLSLGLSILTYHGQATLGVACDAGLVPDPDSIIEGFHTELELLRQGH